MRYLRNEIARRLGNGEGQHTVEDRGHRHHEEHPAPGLQPQPQLFAGAAGQMRQQVVDRQRQEDARHDRQLLQRAEPPADARRRGLRDVHRRDDGGHADADAADDPEHHQHPDTARQSKVKSSLVPTKFTDRPAPIALIKNSSAAIFITAIRPILSASLPAVIAPAAAPSSADATAKPSLKPPMPNVVLDRRHRAVDDRAVVAEQQAAEGRYRGDPDDAAAVFGFLVVHARCRITDGSVSHVTSLPQHCVMEVTFNHRRRGQAVRSPELRNQLGMNGAQIGDVEPGQRRNVPSPPAARHLDVVGHHQHRASGALGRRGSGHRVLDGQALLPAPSPATPRHAGTGPARVCRCGTSSPQTVAEK